MDPTTTCTSERAPMRDTSVKRPLNDQPSHESFRRKFRTRDRVIGSQTTSPTTERVERIESRRQRCTSPNRASHD